MRIASFDVDAQKGFTPICEDELPVPEGDLIVPQLEALARRADLRIGSKDAHPPVAPWIVETHAEMGQKLDFPNADQTWVSHCVPGTEGFELLDGLPHPVEYDFFVWKGIEPDLHPYGACYHDIEEHCSTGVIEYLRQNEVSHVLVGGLALEFCVKTTVVQLHRAGFVVCVYLPACRPLNPVYGKNACVEMKEMGIALCSDLEQLDALLDAMKVDFEPIA